MTAKAQAVLLLALSFTLGLFFFHNVTEKKNSLRDPANADGKIFQLNHLSSDQIKLKLQQNIKVTPTINGKKAIYFSGFSSAICKSYPNIEVEFVAEGIAVAGESPVMNITAPCTEGSDRSEIASIYLPVAHILNSKPGNSVYKIDGFNASISFKHSADEWPRQWVLKRVEFKHVGGDNKAASFGRSPASLDEQPIVLEF